MRCPCQLAIQLIDPGVIGTHDPGGIAFTRQQLMRAVFADVVKGAQDALAIADNGDRVSRNLDGDIGTGVAGFLHMAHPLP